MRQVTEGNRVKIQVMVRVMILIAEGDEGSSEPGDGNSNGNDSGDVQGAALENNADALQARRTGKVSAMSRELAKFALNDDQTNRFYMLSAKAQGFILQEEKDVVHRLLSMEGFFKDQADAFFMYSADTRAQILGLDDSAIVPGLNQRLEEALLAGTLTQEDLIRFDQVKSACRN